MQYIQDNWPMNQPDLLPIKFQTGGDQKHKLIEVAYIIVSSPSK